MEFLGFLWGNLLANLDLVAALLAMYLVVFLAHREAARAGLRRGTLNDLELWVLLGALLGARLAAAMPVWDLYLRSPLDLLRLNLGLSFYGALVGVAIALALGARARGLPFWVLADAYALFAPLGISLYRFGCLLYGNCVGKLASPPLGLALHGLSKPRYPSDLYEGVLAMALFGALVFIGTRKPGTGVILGVFLVAYPLVRAAVGLTRLPLTTIPGGDLGPSLGLAAIGLGFLALRWRRGRSG